MISAAYLFMAAAHLLTLVDIYVEPCVVLSIYIVKQYII